MMNVIKVVWGLVQMIFLSFWAILAIIIYHVFGTMSKWVKLWDNKLTYYYKETVLDGNRYAWAWYYPVHIFYEIIISILWLIIAPSNWLRLKTIWAIEHLG